MNHRTTSPVRRGLTSVFAIGSLAALLTACGPDGGNGSEGDGETTTFSVALEWISNVEYGGFWLAEANGYYEENGIEIDWIPGGPEAPSVQSALAAGSADIGVSAGMRNVVEAMADNEMVILGSVFQENPGCMLWLDDEPVETADDLTGGRTILAQDESTIEALFSINDLEPDYTFVPTSFDPGPLVEGDGDAYTAYYVNQPVTMELDFGLTEGEDYGCTLYSELGLPEYASNIHVMSDLVDSDREALIAFLDATKRGWEDYLEDPEAAAELAVEDYGADLGLDIEQQNLQAQRQVDMIVNDFTDENGILYMDAEVLDGEIAEALEASGLEAVPPAEEMMDLSLLDDIDD